MTKVYNKKSEQKKRRQLRNNPTYTEKILWLSLRKRQVEGTRFLRQYSINKFVIDFYAPEIKLAIEVDGCSHIGKEKYDLDRQMYIEAFNIKVIRFTDEQVGGNADRVVEEIKRIVREMKK
ncbi:MAG: endonuclease domain-containing protein [Ignavibacteriaceae bacterium]